MASADPHRPESAIKSEDHRRMMVAKSLPLTRLTLLFKQYPRAIIYLTKLERDGPFRGSMATSAKKVTRRNASNTHPMIQYQNTSGGSYSGSPNAIF